MLETSRLWREVVIGGRARTIPTSRSSTCTSTPARCGWRPRPTSFDVMLARQPVRRHPERPGGVDRRLARPAAVGDDRRPRRSLRAGPRLGARHRRQGHRQSDRRHRQRRDAAALHRAAWSSEAADDRARHRRGAGRRRAHRATWPARRTRALARSEMGQAIEDALAEARDRRHCPTMPSERPHRARCSTRSGTRTSCASLDDGRSLLYIDLHLVHEVTSPQAFEGLRLAGRPVRRPDLTFATVDHNVPTTARAPADRRSAGARAGRGAAQQLRRRSACRCSTSTAAARASST